jgi:hypothetical protein
MLILGKQTIKKVTKGLMKPQGMLLDFEEALSQGFTNIFPVASVLADFLWWRKARRGSTMTVVITMT